MRLFSVEEMTNVSFAFCVIPSLDSIDIITCIYIYINKKLSLYVYLKDIHKHVYVSCTITSSANELIFRETFFTPIKKNRVYFFSFMDTRTSRALSFEGGSRWSSQKPLPLSSFPISERTICGTIHSKEACCVILIDKSFFTTTPSS